MSELPDEATYDMAYEAFKRAPLGSSIVRAIVDAVWPIAVAEGRRQIADVLRDHFLAEMVCDHERERDNPRCACSRVHLGWYPTVVEAAEGWIAHVLAQGVGDA